VTRDAIPIPARIAGIALRDRHYRADCRDDANRCSTLAAAIIGAGESQRRSW
jgi:hypothetical protein